jgi:(p)ppGpp synthase/HD superfamily hydrolase
VGAFDQDLFKRALEFAAQVHRDQKVPGSGFPYVVHVAKVAMEVLAATEEDEGAVRNLALACALLHDTVEDSGPAEQASIRERIRAEFGPEIADGVDALTKDDRLPKAERMADSLRRIRQHPRAVWLVKLADRITNLEPPPPSWSIEKCIAYAAEARAILETLGDASDRLRRRFEQKLTEYEAYRTRAQDPRKGEEQ